MPKFDSSLSNVRADLRPVVGALPYIEIDQSTVSYGPSSFRGNGVVYYESGPIRVQFIYFGSFDYSSPGRLAKSTLTGFNIASPEYGSFVATGFSLRVGLLTGSPDAFGRALLAEDDEIIGSRFGEVIEPYLGNDVVYAGGGDDQLIGRFGVDVMYGEAGSDTFVVSPGAGPSWYKRRGSPDGFIFDSRRIKKGRKKTTQVLVDTDFVICPDFSISEDIVSYAGISPDGVTVDDMSRLGGQGIGFFQGTTLNLLAYFPNVSKSQYDANNGFFEV